MADNLSGSTGFLQLRAQRPSLLYRVEPEGRGTGQIESLYNLLQRLAFQHSLRSDKLIRHVLGVQPEIQSILQGATLDCMDTVAVSRPDSLFKDRDWYIWTKSGSRLIGTGEIARRWHMALAFATGQRDLSACTLSGLETVVSSTNLVRRARQICIECVKNDVASGKLPYHRLLWSMGAVKCCPVHRTYLVSVECGRPNERRPSYLRVPHPGACGYCGAVGFSCNSTQASACEQENVWLAQQCSDMLLALQGDWRPSPKGLRDQIHALMQRYGGICKYSTMIGVPQSILSRWMNTPGTRLSLEALLDIAWLEGVSVPSLLQGNLRYIEMPLLLRFPLRRRRLLKAIDHDHVKHAMHMGLSEGVPLSEIARRLGVDRSALKAHSDLYAAVRDEARKCKAAQSAAGDRASVQQALAAIQELSKQGMTLSLRNVNLLHGGKWFPSQCRAKCFQYMSAVLRGSTTVAGTRIKADLRELALQALASFDVEDATLFSGRPGSNGGAVS